MQSIDLTPLIQISRRYDADGAFVLAGGGNTSLKQGDRLWVKASGHALATIGAEGFVELDRTRLDAMLHGTWPADSKAREAAFIEAVMAARVHPELGQRPSVEALLHHLLPSRLVVHTHPGLINAVTCCIRGEAIARELFADRVLWQPYVDPGLILAQTLEASLAQHRAGAQNDPAAIFLANHGLIVGGETADTIEQESSRLVAALRTRIGPETSAAIKSRTESCAEVLKHYADALVAQHPELSPVIDTSDAVLSLISTPACREAAVAGPLTPDQIVYCRSTPLWFDAPSDDAATIADQCRSAWDGYLKAHGGEPWIALIAGGGMIALRKTRALSEVSRSIFADAAGVYGNASRLGGVNLMRPEHRRFIEEWEVEAYRRSVMNASTQ